MMIRLVVAVKRKLQLYYWKSRKFHTLREDLALPDVPRALTWCMEAIAVAFKHDYWLVTVRKIIKWQYFCRPDVSFRSVNTLQQLNGQA